MIFIYDNDLRYKCVCYNYVKILGWQHLSPFTLRPFTWSHNFFGCFCWTVSSDAEDLVAEESVQLFAMIMTEEDGKKLLCYL